MSSADPLVIFLAGGATGILGTVVAEVAASKRQARQLRHELKLHSRELALKEVEGAVELIYEVFHAFVRLRLLLARTAPVDRIDGKAERIETLLRELREKVVELGALDIRLSLRFGDSKLIDRFSSILKEFDRLIDELDQVFKEEIPLKKPSSYEPLATAMSEFAESARSATGGI